MEISSADDENTVQVDVTKVCLYSDWTIERLRDSTFKLQDGQCELPERRLQNGSLWLSGDLPHYAKEKVEGGKREQMKFLSGNLRWQ